MLLVMKNFYTVGEVSKMFGISKDTVRLYDKMGIISPAKSDANNYRQYTREDLIFFYHVNTLKKLKLPLTMIKTLLHESNTSDCIKCISDQEQIIDDKIIELIKLKQTLVNYKNILNEDISDLSVIKIQESSAVIYKYIDLNDTNSINNVLYDFNKLSNNKIPLYTFVMNKEFVFMNESETSIKEQIKYMKNAISIKDDGTLLEKPYFKQGKFYVMKPRICISYIVRTGKFEQYKSFAKLKKYIEDNNLKIIDNYFARAVSLSRYRADSSDFYEILIPISY